MSPISRKVRNAIEKLVKEHVAQYGVTVAEINSGMDHINEEVINILLHYEDPNERVPVKVVNSLSFDTFRELEKLGEERYPVYRHRYAAERKFVDA